MTILIYIVAFIGSAAGILSTLYLLFSIPVILGWKFYRKFRYGISLNN